MWHNSVREYVYRNLFAHATLLDIFAINPTKFRFFFKSGLGVQNSFSCFSFARLVLFISFTSFVFLFLEKCPASFKNALAWIDPMNM